MKKTVELVYHKGQNFGDALNPFIFENYLGDNFSETGDVKLIGIGTILGLKKIEALKIVFSSGATKGNDGTYGKAPLIDESYDVFCVRGPKTAELLGINNSYAVCDGAYLLNDFYDFSVKKKYKYAYMPHHKSEDMYRELKKVFADLGIKFISPADPYKKVLKELAQSEKVITDAMHGAIVADAFRVPWIPTKGYPFINDFKWGDFTSSMEITNFKFNQLPKLHDISFFEKIIKDKIKIAFIAKFLAPIVSKFRVHSYKRKIQQIIKADQFYLSNDKIIESKVAQLKNKLEALKIKYF
ncbi:polysaccharide pyruvyl transferase family protein [uncultured Winogradskyella sp.]|uniref:polysaccharide pyruvyl transferase family protein n=1 Tax=uncultured Winogradskyella sp. TaxID=395353 RepID=UPI002638198D|nr:polysaccharide pyruvyl transferase family protein [uncultured Winogradskyella sp.]